MSVQETLPQAPGRFRIYLPALQDAAILLLVALGFSMLGILTRPLGFLAAIWPANAVILGLLVRRARPAGPGCWIGAFLGFMLAGWLTGDAPEANFWLTAANLAGILTGYLLFRRLDVEHRRLQRPLSMLHLFVVTLAASSAAALVGCWLTPFIFGRSVSAGLAFWFTTEFSNYVIALPVLLTFPKNLSSPDRQAATLRYPMAPHTFAMPLVALVLSFMGSLLIGGPGTIAFAVPALLWCALTYGHFHISLIVLVYSAAMMVAQSAGFFVLPASPETLDGTSSFRLGITLLALGPLTITSIIQIQRRLLKELDLAVSRDSLTGLLARHAFLERSDRLRLGSASRGVAVLMMDIDRFKQINDRYGHGAGDAVLAAVAKAIAADVRQQDLIGRLGGEEFAMTLPNIGPADAQACAERLCRRVEALSVQQPDAPALHATISIGLVHRSRMPDAGIASLLPLADAALYRAKAEGRNRVVTAAEEKWEGAERPRPIPSLAPAVPRASR